MAETSCKQLNKHGDKRGLHINSLANLKPVKWKPGESGNSVGWSLTSMLKHQMSHPLKEPPENASANVRFVYSTIRGALKREPIPFREIWDRLEGRPVQPLTGAGGGSLEHVLRVYIDGKLVEKV